MRLFNNYLLPMMKTIKSIQQLQTEKKRIKQQQQNLEDKIRSNWSELKESLKPANVAKDALGKIIENKTEENINGESILKSTFTYGASLLAKKMADKAGEKWAKFFKK
jgi:predicted Holliday junction resolvase-like endonuclease